MDLCYLIPIHNNLNILEWSGERGYYRLITDKITLDNKSMCKNYQCTTAGWQKDQMYGQIWPYHKMSTYCHNYAMLYLHCLFIRYKWPRVMMHSTLHPCIQACVFYDIQRKPWLLPNTHDKILLDKNMYNRNKSWKRRVTKYEEYNSIKHLRKVIS